MSANGASLQDWLTRRHGLRLRWRPTAAGDAMVLERVTRRRPGATTTRAAVIHDLDRILAPADPETLVPDVQATLAVCAARERSGDDVAMLIAVLARELADLPGFAVRAALARWRRSEKWWPSLAELRHLAFVEARDLLELRDWLARPPPAAPKPPPEPRCTPAEAAAILAVHGIVPAPNRNVEQQFDDTPTTPPEAWERLAEETADG